MYSEYSIEVFRKKCILNIFKILKMYLEYYHIDVYLYIVRVFRIKPGYSKYYCPCKDIYIFIGIICSY